MLVYQYECYVSLPVRLPESTPHHVVMSMRHAKEAKDIQSAGKSKRVTPVMASPYKHLPNPPV
jgi:hypothetical protein